MWGHFGLAAQQIRDSARYSNVESTANGGICQEFRPDLRSTIRCGRRILYMVNLPLDSRLSEDRFNSERESVPESEIIDGSYSLMLREQNNEC